MAYLRKLAPTVFVAASVLGSSSAFAADVLVYGPSLAPENCGSPEAPTGANPAALGGCRPAGDDVVNEATVASDHGHDVTVVDGPTWSAMTQNDFASYDAIVIGDAGCDFSDGEDLDPVNDNKAVWSPVVTGNVTLNGFDGFFHIFQDANTEAGIRALAGSGIDWAASGAGTGLYYSNGCRDFPVDCKAAGGCRGGSRTAAPEGGDLVTLDFLSELGQFVILDESANAITITQPEHPAMAGTTETNLSGWGSSTHAKYDTFPGTFSVAAIGAGGEDAPEGEGDPGPVVIVSGFRPRTWVDVPTLSPAMLALLAVALAGAAAFALRRRRA